MLTYQFFAQNLHFITGLFTALVFFAVWWLYFDAWLSRRLRKDLLKWTGFAVLSVSYLFYAVIIEQPVFGSSPFGHFSLDLSMVLRLVGYALVFVGLTFLDPLQSRPQTKGLELDEPTPATPQPPMPGVMAVGVSGPTLWAAKLLLPLGAAAVAWQYFRHSAKGLERHLRPVAVAFTLFAVADVIDMVQRSFDGTTNPLVYNLVSPFGWLWQAHQLVLLAAAITLGRWVWRYLIDRFITQFFMIFTVMILMIFMVITICFTAVLVNNIQNETTETLKTTARTLQYAISSKQEQTAAAANILSHDPAILAATQNQDHNQLVSLSGSSLSGYHLSSLIITNNESKVLLRAEDPRRWDDSVSSSTLVQRALIGQNSTSTAVAPGVGTPTISFISSSPIRDASGQIIGTVTAAIKADNALVDGIKAATGLSSSLYAGNVLAATTLTQTDGSRQTGSIEHNPAVTRQVLRQGKLYATTVLFQERSYTGVYAPLKDVDNGIVGMLFVGRPQAGILSLAGRSIQTTFAVATLLLLLSIVPAFLTARYLARQLD